jgi:hypothetical protein
MGAIKYLLSILLILIPATALADYTCTVPTDGTFNECVALCDGKTGVVTIDVTGATFTMSSFSMAAWEASSVVIKGAGRDSTTCTSDAATITAAASIPFEIYGITFNSSLTFYGSPTGFKIHDNTFVPFANIEIYWSGGVGHAYGVIYRNNLHKVMVMEDAANRFDSIHELFTQAPPLGNVGSSSNGVVYIEGNTYTDRVTGYLTDSENGGRLVFRYNTINAIESAANLACHSINDSSTSGSGYRMRGAQMWEWYKNDYTNSVYSAMFTQIRSGTGVFFGNNITRAGSGLAAIHIDNKRSNYSTSYADGKCRGHFDWDGNETIDSTQAVLATYYGNTHFLGTHDGSNDAATLTDSTAAWKTNRLAPSSTSPGTTVYNVTDGSKCLITANDGTTITCTLAGGTDNDWDTGDSYRISDGYPCRDQIGHTYQDAELFDNSPITPNAKQSLYPMYVWGNQRNGVAMNTIFVATGGSDKHILNNREYFTSAGASCTAGGACTSGVGSGSAKPTTCAVNTAFWDTDESALYKCTETDTWTKYYEPATCPHPLAGAGTCGAGTGAGAYALTEDASVPVLVSATLAADGVSLSLLFSRAITATINTGVTVTPSSGTATATYASGTTTTTLVYTLSRAISSTANGGSLTVSYTQPGNGLEATDDGQDVLTFTNTSVINNSTQGNTLKTVTPSAGTGCGISPDTATTVVSGLTAVFYVGANQNYYVSSIGGTCGGSGTSTYTTDAITADCTVSVSCTKISPDVAIGSGGAAVTLGSGAVGTLY